MVNRLCEYTPILYIWQLIVIRSIYKWIHLYILLITINCQMYIYIQVYTYMYPLLYTPIWVNISGLVNFIVNIFSSHYQHLIWIPFRIPIQIPFRIRIWLFARANIYRYSPGEYTRISLFARANKYSYFPRLIYWNLLIRPGE